MPRPTTIAIYSVVFGVALFAGFLIAALLLPQSLPIGSLATPTATIESLASVAELVAAAPATTPEPLAATAAPPTASATIAPTSTPQPSPTVTASPMPSATPTIAPTVASPSPTTAPKPLAFEGRVVEQPTDAAVSCGASFESRIWGTVKDRGGHGFHFAVVEVRSADGKHRYRAQTNDQGGFELPGLGCTSWIVRLVSVPRAPAGVQVPELHVNLNGGRYSGAGIDFRQR